MLQLAYIRQHREEVRKGLAIKNFKEPELVEEIISLDEIRRKNQAELDALLARRNAASREIGQLMGKGLKEEAEKRKAEVARWKTRIEEMEQAQKENEAQLDDLLVRLPNLPSSLVPPGNTPEENVVVQQGGTVPDLPGGAMPHWELAKKFNLIDFELGNKITGSGFPVYRGKGARLQRAMILYFLDFNTRAGYEEYLPPFMVNKDSAFGTGQLPDKEGQMYYIGDDNLFLIPTAEVPVTNIYRDRILKESELPVKMTAYTPCFRREAGSYGKDVRGLNRVHQFDKVEIVQITTPEKSYAVLDEMVAHVEKLVQWLGLPYRILRLCGGDMGFASALTYDFEVYCAAQEKWLEVSSVTNFESFQSHRMKIRYKDESGNSQLVHTLNGSSLALPRILASILENYQDQDGIQIPEVLQPYFGAARIE